MTAAPTPTETTVQFSALAHHLEEQIRGHTEEATVNRYRKAIQAGEVFPPLLVAEVAGALVLVDGFHRRDALEALGRDEAPARIVPCSDLRKARWLGFDANLRHGQPLKAKHLRPALRAYIEAAEHTWQDGRLRSYREIAADLPGVSYSTVRRWIEADFPELFVAMGGAEGAGPGGAWEMPSEGTPEDEMREAALAHIAEAKALVAGLAGADRARAADAVRALLADLTWDDESGPDLSTFVAAHGP